MVEAAILFPLVILTLACLITVLVHLYEEAESRSQLHRTLLRESGSATDCYFPGESIPKPAGAFTSPGVAGMHPVVEGAITLRRGGFGPMESLTPLHVESRSYLLDEQKYLMLKALGKEAAEFGKD